MPLRTKGGQEVLGQVQGLVNLLEPRGSIYTTIMELGPKNHNGDGLLGPNSIMVVYMDPLGKLMACQCNVTTPIGRRSSAPSRSSHGCVKGASTRHRHQARRQRATMPSCPYKIRRRGIRRLLLESNWEELLAAGVQGFRV